MKYAQKESIPHVHGGRGRRFRNAGVTGHVIDNSVHFDAILGKIRWRVEQSTWLIWRKVGLKNLEIRPAGKWSKILCNLKRVSKRRLQSQNSRRFYALGHCRNLIIALEVHYENLCVRLGIYLPDYLLKLFLPPTQFIRSSKSSALCHNFVICRSQNSLMAISRGGGTPT